MGIGTPRDFVRKNENYQKAAAKGAVRVPKRGSLKIIQLQYSNSTKRVATLGNPHAVVVQKRTFSAFAP